MTIQRKVLLESLKKVMPGIESGKAVLQGADSFIFHDGKIFTYNDSISVTVPLKNAGIIEENLEGAVKADEFFKIINKFTNDEINFVVTENNSWMLKCGKAKVEMTLLNFDFENRIKDIEPSEDWSDLDSNFLESLRYCKMSNNKTWMSGVYVKGVDVVSTDGWQINNYKLKSEMPEFWISDSAASEVEKISNLTKIQSNGNWIHFKSDDDSIFSVKGFSTSQFPIEKITKVIGMINSDSSNFHNTFPKTLFEVIDRAVLFSMDVSNHSVIRLDLTSKFINVSTESSIGKYNEKVEWETEMKDGFEDISVLVDTEMISSMSKKLLEFYVIPSNGASKLLFKSENSIHLMSTFSMN